MDVSSIERILEELRAGADRSPVEVERVEYHGFAACSATTGRKYVDWSVLRTRLEETKRVVDWDLLVRAVASEDAAADRALGCMMGMALGDAIGAPLEFAPACGLPADHPRRTTKVEFRSSSSSSSDPNDYLVYTNELNAFRLERGQWTDDASMGFCMAESMLARGGYVGGDVRVRFFLWWFFGYCNAFRHEQQQQQQQQKRTSVGLGGNIGKSLQDLVTHHTGKSWEEVPGRFETTTTTTTVQSQQDAGNGSLMRLAPIPIRYHSDSNMAMKMAEESSYATHPGPDAANCCRFVAFFITRAMTHRRTTTSGDGTTMTTTIDSFTDRVIREFIAGTNHQHRRERKSGWGKPFGWSSPSSKGHHHDVSMTKLVSLLLSDPPTTKEACWNWKADEIAIEQTLRCRGRDDEYNGYPISDRYFGSYCMDGLAMALWAIVHSNSVLDCILKVVNLCGDADTTGAIAGQMAGAFYGYRSILLLPQQQQQVCEQQQQQQQQQPSLLADVRRWDPLMEIELRALLLYRDGQASSEHNTT